MGVVKSSVLAPAMLASAPVFAAVTININPATLTVAAMDAHNTFKQSDLIKPAPFAAQVVDGTLRPKIPVKAVVAVALER